MDEAILKTLTGIAQAIFDKKGFNILVLDACEFSTLADFFVIAEGGSDRHVRALTDAAIEELDKRHRKVLAVEGKREAEWVAIDYGDIIIHLFSPGLREKYSLEELWRQCRIVDVPIVVGKGSNG